MHDALLQPHHHGFAGLVPRLPSDYQPLVRARQNHLLLSRSVELMQNFMSSLFPSRQTTVYTDHGTKLSHSLPSRPLYEAVG